MATKTVALKTDIVVQNEGSIIVLQVISPAAKVWIAKHIGETTGFQPLWPNSVVVEPRYVMDIVRGAIADGLVVD